MSSPNIFTFATLSLLSFSPSQAQELSVEEVVITASRVPVAREQSGSAITIIDGSTLRDRQIPTVFDALREVPGVAVSRTGALGGLAQIRIRGGEANHTLTLIDGVEANDPAASSQFNFAHLMSANIERVEILRGPQSALWGADAVSGVVHIVTATPRSGFFASGAAEGGSFGTHLLSGLINAGDENFGVVLDGLTFKTHGSNISRTGNEKDGYENTTLGARAFFQASPHFRLDANVRNVTSRVDFDTGFPYPVDSDDFTEAVQSYGRAQATIDFWDGMGEAILGASLTQTRSDNFSGGTLANAVDGEKTKFEMAANFSWQSEMFGAPARQRISVVGETVRERFSQVFVTLAAADQNQSIGKDGVAVEYWLGFDQRLFLSLSARHDWNQRFSNTVTWRTTLSAPVAPVAAVRVHASAGTGVKNPDFFELFGFTPATFVGNPSLKPERSFGTDVGLEVSLLSGMVLLDATYFHSDLENEIFTDFTVSPNTARNAAGGSKRSGLELAASAELGSGWSLSGTYTYTDSSVGGTAELRRPYNIGSLNIDYRFAQGAGLVTLGADFHGEQRDTDFATFTAVNLPAYTLVRLAGSYDIGNGLALTARIENALDEDYEEIVGYRARGIGVFVGIRAAIGQ